MNKGRSINQNSINEALPNFRNLGITLRILLISNGMALLLALSQASGWADVIQKLLQIATLLTPILLSTWILLWAMQPWLTQMSYWRGVLVVNVVAAVVTLFICYFGGELFNLLDSDNSSFGLARNMLLSVMVSSVLLTYFRMRTLALSSSVHDARLQVLRARIRPHFLFNTINAVLGIVRTQPKQAETALEDMADLFRMAMSDARDLVPLQKEVQLSRQYIALEQMRMGERLHVDWKLQDLPEDALIPQLLLQPLLENAVYHGIEPLHQGGNINVTLSRKGEELRLMVNNPRLPSGEKLHRGNKVALQNIRERLHLLFDAEAHYQVESGKDFYRVEIALPYVKVRPKLKERST